jgi:hypothetical protein
VRGAGLVDPVDQLALVVRLPALYLDAEALPGVAAQLFDASASVVAP